MATRKPKTMHKNDFEQFAWERETYGNTVPPPWSELKYTYAEHLLATKTKPQIHAMLCGPATGSCLCTCPCPAGIAWDKILKNERKAP